ncbi:MAG: histidine--tRNA ligase [Armatimonadota bacterium]|nr:histidine--tRNA ligase [Armatimonadota bacterium]MDR7468820.1 histidine--tRNA ligase [Armatimonadota bacterium]MDR7473659.1 histidine--tRNA ligase [Armatimonadota bacterium]
MRYQVPRGMRDILPEEVGRWQALEQRVRQTAERFGFREIRTPAVEHTEVFARTVGEESDMVQKEMYTFTDRGGRSLTLRPEGTAAVVRAYLGHGGPSWPQPVKLYYVAPMFRYDRPQLGRYRQHVQFGAEIIGVPGPEADAEVISLPVRLLQSLGLTQVEVRLNSVGDPVCRPRYLEALRQYFGRYARALCADCQRRLQTNPLRILDCKEAGCRRITAEAPPIYGYLDAACREHFEGVQAHFQALEIPYVLDPFIVRGLDYYTRTAVEVFSGRLGAQNAMFGGGRYDGLAQQLGGPPTPGVGFGLGLERLLLVLEQEGLPIPTAETPPAVFVVAVGEAARREAIRVVDRLRRAGIAADRDLLNRAVRAQMRHADRLGARVALILGDSELASGEVTLRVLAAGSERRVPLGEVVSAVSATMGEGR